MQGARSADPGVPGISPATMPCGSVCTHQGCTITGYQNQTYVCPCHGSQFNTNGGVVAGPAVAALRRVTVQFAESAFSTEMRVSPPLDMACLARRNCRAITPAESRYNLPRVRASIQSPRVRSR
jgi:hypothetical protein